MARRLPLTHRDQKGMFEVEHRIIVPKEQLEGFMCNGAMNHQYGIQVFLSVDKEKAQALLPPPLKVADPGVAYIYIVNIREPTFAPWYMEGGIGIMVEFNGVVGLHFLGLQLSGPGALMGMCSGREGSGLPKKLCERIHVERLGNRGHCFIERGGVRLVDVELEMGQYNDPIMKMLAGAQENCSQEKPITTDGGCLLFRYRLEGNGFHGLEMTFYDSPTRFTNWEPASAKVALASTEDDPWGDLPVTGVLGAGWMVSDNWVKGQRILRSYPDSEASDVMQYLFSGRYDRCTLCGEHQVYE